MEFLSCTIVIDSIEKCFHSAETAIGYIESSLNQSAVVEGAIVVKAQSGEANYWFSDSDALLESLMNL